MGELAEVGVGHGLIDPVAVGVARGEMERAKEPIEAGEEAGEVFVGGGGALVGVVPVMEDGGGDEALERAEAEADVGVDENREEAVDSDEEAEGLFGEAEEIDGDDAADADKSLVDGMEAAGGGPVEVLAGVVDGVEAPEKRHGVGPAVAPIGAEFEDKNRDQELRPTREREQALLERRVNEKAEGLDEAEDDEKRQEFADAAGDEEVDEIGAESGALPELAPDDREERLQRHEEREEDHEAEGEAGGVPEFVHGGGDGMGVGRVTRVGRLDAPALRRVNPLGRSA